MLRCSSWPHRLRRRQGLLRDDRAGQPDRRRARPRLPGRRCCQQPLIRSSRRAAPESLPPSWRDHASAPSGRRRRAWRAALLALGLTAPRRPAPTTRRHEFAAAPSRSACSPRCPARTRPSARRSATASSSTWTPTTASSAADKVDLVVADEGNGAPTAVPAATKLIKQDKVRGAHRHRRRRLGRRRSTPLLTEAKIPLVGSNGRPELKDVSRVWHTSYLSDEPGAAIAQYVTGQRQGHGLRDRPGLPGRLGRAARLHRRVRQGRRQARQPRRQDHVHAVPGDDQLHPVLRADQGLRRDRGLHLLRRRRRGRLRQAVRPVRDQGRPAVRGRLPHRGRRAQRAGRRGPGHLLRAQLLARPRQRGEPGVRRRLEGQARRRRRHLRDGLVRRGGGAGPGDRRGRRRPDAGGDQHGDRRARARSTARAAPGSSPRPPTRRCRSGTCAQVRQDGRALSNTVVGDLATVGG